MAAALLISLLLHGLALAWLRVPASVFETARVRTPPIVLEPPMPTALEVVSPPARPRSTPPSSEAALPTAVPVPVEVEVTEPPVTAAPAVSAPLATREAASGDSAAAPAVAALAAAAARGDYELQIAHWVERHRDYPLVARRRGLEGTAIVRLRLAADGSLLQAQIVRDTGHVLLDRAALGMVERAAPYPRAPAELGTAPVEILVPIQFSLGR